MSCDIYIQSTSFLDKSNNAHSLIHCALIGKRLWIDVYVELEL